MKKSNFIDVVISMFFVLGIFLVFSFALLSSKRTDTNIYQIEKEYFKEYESETTYFFYTPLFLKSGSVRGVVNEDEYWPNEKNDFHNQMLKVTARQHQYTVASGIYNFSELDYLTSGNTQKLWVTVFGSQPWLNGYQPPCEPPLPIFYLQYFYYIDILVERYHIDYFEIWNEPDADYIDSDYARYIGCFGDTYKAGKEYALFANAVITHLHNTFPDIEVIVGAVASTETDFIHGLFDNIDGADGFSFHHYEWRSTDPSNYSLQNIVNYLRTQTDLPLYLSETSVLCGACDYVCEYRQSVYASQLYVMENLSGKIWYNGPYHGWYCSDLKKEDGSKKMPYYEWVK